MPTYRVIYANLVLENGQLEQMAAAITRAHHDATGAPAYLAQVLFEALGSGRHFVGGKANSAPHIFVHGLIRAGRTSQQIKLLIQAVRDDVQGISGVGSEDIWVYVQEIPAAQMLEFGRFLPAPGAESEWGLQISSKKKAQLLEAGIILPS